MTTTIDYQRSQKVADAMIRRWGRPGALRRGGVDRPVVVAIVNYSVAERLGSNIQSNERKALLSAVVAADNRVDIPPSQELDRLVTFLPDGSEEVLPIVAPPQPLAIDTGVVVRWMLPTRL
jgi:hypothetical protein